MLRNAWKCLEMLEMLGMLGIPEILEADYTASKSGMVKQTEGYLVL